MLTTEPTLDMIAEWKQIFDKYHFSMKANRRTGNEVNQYFKTKYIHQILENEEFKKIVTLNITENDFSCSKLPKGVLPNVRSYQTGNVLVGIDLSSGEIHIEGENIEECIPIYDDLFVYRGLDEDDLKNYFLVAQYVQLTQSET